MEDTILDSLETTSSSKLPLRNPSTLDIDLLTAPSRKMDAFIYRRSRGSGV